MSQDCTQHLCESTASVRFNVDSYTPVRLNERAGSGSGPAVLGKVGGRFQFADKPNANNRVYPKGLWESVLSSDKVKSRLAERSMYGELDHPTDRKATSLKEASHVVTMLEMRSDGEIYGEAEVLDTPYGRVLNTLLAAKTKPGISSRANGGVRKLNNGILEVLIEGFKLDTWDFVSVPSTEGAFPALLQEHVEAHEHAVYAALTTLVEASGDPSTILAAGRILSQLSNQPLRESAAQTVASRTEALVLENTAPTEPSTPTHQDVNIMSEQLHEAAVAGLLTEERAKLATERTALQEQATLAESEARTSREKVSLLEAKLLEADEKAKEMEKAKAKDEDEDEEKKDSKEKNEAAETIIEQLLIREDAACRIIDEAVAQLREANSRAAAGEALVESMLDQQGEYAKSIAIDEAIAALPEGADAASMRALLEAAPNAATVRSQAESAVAMITPGGRAAREPLPTPATLNESAARVARANNNSNTNSRPVLHGLLRQMGGN